MASTSEVYGDPLVNPQPDSYWGNVNPISPRGVYDELNRFAEAMTMAYHRYHGADTTHDPVNILNPRELTVGEIARMVIKLSVSSSQIHQRPLPIDDPKVRRPDIRRVKALLD